MHRTLASVGGALLLVLILAVGVRADAPTTTLYACVNNSSGTIHMIDATGSCASNEQLVVWNQVGPTGPQGPQGQAGPQGVPGPQGPAGTNGVSGYQIVTHTYSGAPSATSTHAALILYGSTFTADCPVGDRAIGGGYTVVNGIVQNQEPSALLPVTPYGSAPVGSNGTLSDGWTISFSPQLPYALYPLDGTNPAQLTVYAICAAVS